MSVVQRRHNGDVLEMSCDRIEVTSNHRPDTSWVVTDKVGHEHRWFANGSPASRYSPMDTHDVPTLVWVKDGEEYWAGDDEPHDVGHLECRQCGEHIRPRYTADDCRQYVHGLRRCCVNGLPVSLEEFQRKC